MTPQHLEILASIGGTLLVALGGRAGVRAGLRWWAGYIERRDQRRAQLEAKRIEAGEHESAREDERSRRHEERDDTTQAWLRRRVEALEASKDECQETLAEAQSLNVQTVQLIGQAREQLARCEERSVVYEQRIDNLESKLARRDADVTQRVRTEVRRSLSQPYIHVAGKSSRDDMEPDDG